MPHQASERWTSRVRPGKRRSITIVLRCSVRITSARSARRSNAVTSKLTGDGRTIVRGSFGRFSAGVLTGESAGFHPAVTPIRTDAFDPSTGGYTRMVSVIDPKSTLQLDPRRAMLGVRLSVGG